MFFPVRPVTLLTVLFLLTNLGCGTSAQVSPVSPVSQVSQVAEVAEVDPALVGTWRLQWPGQEITWEIRADGTYEISGPGAIPPHNGTFHSAAGKWALKSATWGEDGGTYQLQDSNTFTGAGKLGPAAWVRVQNATPPSIAGRDIVLSTQADDSRLLPKDIPELMQAAVGRARSWRSDAIPVSIDFKHWDSPNLSGPEVRISFLSPAGGAGLRLTVTTRDVRPFEFTQTVNEAPASLPSLFVDLPEALRIARANGMRGALNSASLRTHNPGGGPILAWMLQAGTNGRTVDAASGQIIEGDVTGYIASYNAQWERAARGLRALMERSRPRPSANGSSFDGNYSVPDSSSANPDNGAARQAELDQRAAEGRAYWGGSAEDYDRVKRGECTWSDSLNYGC